MTPTKQIDSSAIEIAELKITTQQLTTLVQDIRENMEGTNRTQGLKEKMSIAQFNIELNKQAYQAVLDEVKHVEDRLILRLKDIEERLGKNFAVAVGRLEASNEAIRAESKTQATLLQKFQPWINGISWAITVAGGVILSLVLSGKLTIGP